MLDRAVIEEFLDYQLGNYDLEIPTTIPKETLVEVFCQYVEDDYYEWLKDNFKTFFNHGNPHWGWIKVKGDSLRPPI
jgi:hypothetical protein